MKKLIQLYGGPSCGKSTQAAFWFSVAKSNGIEVELVREYVKNWVWEGRGILPGDQVYLTAKQTRLERILKNDLEMIITDSPCLLGAFYEGLNGKNRTAALQIVKEHTSDMAEKGWVFHHVFLERGNRPFNPQGRFHTEEESLQYDHDIKTFIESNLDQLDGVHKTHNLKAQIDFNFPEFLRG